MKSTLLSSKGNSSLRMQSFACDTPPIICNTHLVLISFYFLKILVHLPNPLFGEYQLILNIRGFVSVSFCLIIYFIFSDFTYWRNMVFYILYLSFSF